MKPCLPLWSASQRPPPPQRGPPRVEEQPAQQPADEQAAADPGRAPVQQVDQRPLGDPARAAGGHRDRGVDDREGQAVVQPGLGGQGEAHLVVVVLAATFLVNGGLEYGRLREARLTEILGQDPGTLPRERAKKGGELDEAVGRRRTGRFLRAS